MPRTAERAATPAPGGATLDFERQLWAMADGLRGHMDAAEYKHVVLGLIFLKYISDAFARLGECRVHGGGLHTLEPKELANLPAGSLLDLLKLPVQRWVQPALA